MGYFSNGTEFDIYQEDYCIRCVHYDEGGCPVLAAHFIHNYEECNKPDSILHMLIPRDGIENKQCSMFHEGDKDPRQQDMFADLTKQNAGGVS